MADTVLVTVPGIMGNMSLATAQSLGLNYTVVPPTPAPALTPVSVSLPPPPPPVAAPVSYAPPLDPFSYIAPLDIPVSVPAQSLVVSPAPSLGSTLGTGTQVGVGAPSYVPAPESLSPASVDYSPPLNPFEYIAPVGIPVSLPALGVEEKKLEEEEEKKKTILGTATDAVAELAGTPIAKAMGAGALAGVNPNPAVDIQNTPIGQLVGGGVFTGSLGLGLAGPSAPVVDTSVVNTPVIGGIDLSGINFSGVDMSGVATESKPNVAPVVVDKGFFGNVAVTLQSMAEEAKVGLPLGLTSLVAPEVKKVYTGFGDITPVQNLYLPSTKEVINPLTGLTEPAPPDVIAAGKGTVEVLKEMGSTLPIVSTGLSFAEEGPLSYKPWLSLGSDVALFAGGLGALGKLPSIAKVVGEGTKVGGVVTGGESLLTKGVPVAVKTGSTVLKVGGGLVFTTGTAALVTGTIQNVVSPQKVDTALYEAPAVKAVAVQDKWKDVQVSTDSAGNSVVEVAPVQAKAYQDAVAEANKLQSGLDKWKQYEFLAADGTVKLNITDEQFGQYKNELAVADAAVNKAKGLFEVYKVNSDKLFGQYSSDMASLSGQIPDIYKKTDGTINVTQMIKDMGEASALSTLAAAGQKPTIAGEIYDKLSPEAKALYTRGNVSTSAQSGLLGAWGRGVETLYNPVSSFLEQHTPTLPVVGNLASGMWNYLVPQQLASSLYEQKGAVGMLALIPHFGATIVPPALNWNETSNLNKAMGIGFAAVPLLAGPVGSVFGKVGTVVGKVPVVGPISKVVGSVVTAPFKLVQDVGEGTGLSKLGQYMPWQAAYVPTKLVGSAGLASAKIGSWNVGASGAKWGWWSKDIVPINQFVKDPTVKTTAVVDDVALAKAKAVAEYEAAGGKIESIEPTAYMEKLGAQRTFGYKGEPAKVAAEKALSDAFYEAGVKAAGGRSGPPVQEPWYPGKYAKEEGWPSSGSSGYHATVEAPSSFLQKISPTLTNLAKSPVVKVGLAGSVLGISLIPGMSQVAHVGQVGGVDVSQASVRDLQAAQSILKQQDSLLSKQSSLVSQLNSGQISAEKYNQEVVSVNKGITSLQQQVDNLPQSVQGVVTPTQSVLQSQAQSLSGQVASVQEEVGGVVVGPQEAGVQSQSLNLPIQQIGQVNISQVSTQISSPTQQALQQTQQTQSQLQQVQVQLQNELQQLQQELQNLINQEQTQINQEQQQQIQQQIQQLQQIQVQVNIQQDILSQYVSEGGIVPPIIPPIFPPMVGSPRGGEGWGGGFGGLLKGGIGTWVTRGYSMVGINPLTGKVIKYQALKKGIRYGNVQRKRLGQPAYKAVRV